MASPTTPNQPDPTDPKDTTPTPASDPPCPPIKIGIIGGTGLGEAFRGEEGESREVETPFGNASSPVTLTTWRGVEVALLQRHGPGHVFNPTQVPYRANIFALKSLGVTHVVASGATGSLREDYRPRDLVVIDQVIDKTYKRANTFYEKAAVHVELADPFCPVMRKWLIQAAKTLGDITTHESGTYVCMEGPGFSTRAESRMHRGWGADLVGMTCMPEAKLAREAELAYAMVCSPTDYDCWRPQDPGVEQQDLLTDILQNLRTSTQRIIDLLKTAMCDISILESEPSAAHDALTLGIWSDRRLIDSAEVERLGPLWGRYFT